MNKKNSHELTEYFFRNEYGKIVAVITKHIGQHNINTAEDIVQETLLKAVEYWQDNGIPENPTAWLYTTAKNKTFNYIKRDKIHQSFIQSTEQHNPENNTIDFSEDIINDEQLRIMFSCCQPNISESTQISLILKILCGFSITEIANAFVTSTETINKRLVRGRKELRKSNIDLHSKKFVNENLETIIETIYLLFNEGYYPSQKNAITSNDFCLEAIRLTTILIKSKTIIDKSNVHALIALMYLNVARFKSRKGEDNFVVEIEQQNRTVWNQDFINLGIQHLNKATASGSLSKYLILAAISANHCIAKKYTETNWVEILELYDKLVSIENTPLVKLNRIIALSKAKGTPLAIDELLKLNKSTDLGRTHLYHTTLGVFYKELNLPQEAIESLKKALYYSKNERDTKIIEKKLNQLVPIS
jgi:RNA polymerase sigma-70 factor (ECF subfamily)